jgi:hypothetical protein
MGEFNPNAYSVIIALNLEPPQDDLALLTKWGITEVTPLIGSYAGKRERSYQIERKNIPSITQLRQLLQLRNQETMIYLKDGKAYIGHKDFGYYTDNMSPSYGYMKQVSKEQAKQTGYFTYCEATDRYFCIVQER